MAKKKRSGSPCTAPMRKGQKYRVCTWKQWTVAQYPLKGGMAELRFRRPDNARTFIKHLQRGWEDRAKTVAKKRLSRKAVS